MTVTDVQQRLRGLPSVDRLLAHGGAQALLARYSRKHVVRCCREVLDDVRDGIRRDGAAADAVDEGVILARVTERLQARAQPALTRVVNASGTVIHTNLGRALLPQAAIDAVAAVAGHPANLEYDLVRGSRGRREEAVDGLLRELTGAEAATVVNNNAAAVLVGLNALAAGREVIVSRGELIEIGGAFRLPEIMEKSGALLREVGTTNRTHPADYERAIGERTALLLKVHTSNYRVVGFAADVGLEELVAIGRRHNIPVMEDLGSGALIDLSPYGLPKEPVVSERIAAGADVVTFSGDKLLGGPQAGLLAGRARWLEEITRNPLHRALRCGKLTIAALEATLRLYQQSPDIVQAIPMFRALVRPLREIEAVGHEAVPLLQRALGPGFRIGLADSTSQIGSGALPTEEIPTKVVAIEHDTMDADRIAAMFRAGRPAIIGRVTDGRFLLDLRTIVSAGDLVPQASGA